MGCNCNKPKPTIRKKSAIANGVKKVNYKGRLEICRKCNLAKYTLNRIRCSKCGCFMEAKASLSYLHCPAGKW